MENLRQPWQQEFNHEMETGYSARASGLEGKSRVCARRALGIIIAEYFTRLGLPSPGPSIQERISALKNLETLPIQNQEIIDHFVIKVDEEYNLPIDVDLLAETTWLADQLLGKEQDEH